MKGWPVKPGVTVHSCAEVRDVRANSDMFAAYISTGSSLGDPQITLELTAPRPDIFGVKIYHHKGTDAPLFNLNTDPQKLVCKETGDAYIIRSGKISATLRKGRYSLSFSYGGKMLTRSDFQLAVTTMDGHFIRERHDLGVDELIYGLGERFTPFVRNGQSINAWNEDIDISGKHIPFYISSKGFGVFVNNPGRVSYEIETDSASRVQFSVAGEVMQYYIIGGGSIKAAVSNYCDLTGKPPLPPAWTLGLSLSAPLESGIDEVNGIIDGMADIPLSVFHYGSFWMKENERCGFQWDEAAFPEPAAMLKRLHKKGLRVRVWISPYIGQKSPLFDEAAEKGYLLRKTDGNVWQQDYPQPGMGIVDFTNPDAAQWYAEKLKALAETGVDCFDADCGGFIPEEGVCWFDGSDPHRMRNYYVYLYHQAVSGVPERKQRSPVAFTRNAAVGGQRFPVQTDFEAGYPAMAGALRGGLSLALGGYAFWSHNVSESVENPGLYKRWLAFALFSTHSHISGGAPWLDDDETADVLRYFTKVKCSLMPYLFAQAAKASQTGVPVMRPMVMEYPDDPFCRALDKQYMLGDSLLAAPVFDEDGHCDVYLPDGMFTNFFSGEVVQGGRMVKGKYSYMAMPVFIPENTLLARGRDDRAEYDYHENVTVHAFQLTEQTIELYDKSGKLRATVTGRAAGDDVSFTVDGDAPGIKFKIHKG